MKIQFRFSLLTLVCFALFLASAGTLWWNCEAWEPAFTVKVDLPVWESGFVPGGKYFWVRCSDKENPKWIVLKMYELPSGRWAGDLSCIADESSRKLWFSPGGTTLSLGWGMKFDEKRGAYEENGFWKIDGLSRVGPGAMKEELFEICAISSQDHYVVVLEHSTKQFLLMSLPEMQTIAPVNSSGFEFFFSHDERWMATRGDVGGKHGVIVYSMSEGKQLFFKETRSALGRIAVAPGDEMLAISDDGDTYVFDTSNWTLKRKVTGKMSYGGINRNGKVLVWDDTWVVHLKDVGDSTYDLPMGFERGVFLSEETVVHESPHRAFDIATRKLIYDEGQDARQHNWTNEHRSIVLRKEGAEDFEIRDARSGAVQSRFRKARWPAMFKDSVAKTGIFDATGSWLVFDLKDSKGAPAEKTVWRLVRPNLPWDAAWMGEFWLTVFFGAALGWSLKRRMRK